MKVNNNADCNGTHLIGYINATYSDLAKALGEPTESDGYKSSCEWILEDDNGDVFTIYDWKATELYDSGYPSVDEFRTSQDRHRFHIGGNSPAAKVGKFLNKKLGYDVNYRSHLNEYRGI